MKQFVLLLCLTVFALAVDTRAQATNAAGDLKSARSLHQFILKTLKDDLVEKYYDPKLRGVDVEKSFKEASALIDKAQTVEEMDDIVARLFYPFKDSHLHYIPPPKTVKVEYGWEMRFYGDKVFVVKVEPESEAFKKGLRPGDQIYMIEDYLPIRNEFWLFRYHFNTLRPVAALHAIIVKPNGAKYRVELPAKIKRESVFMPSSRELELAAEKDYMEDTKQLFDDEKYKGVAVWRMPTFALSIPKIEKMMGRVRKNGSLILDLRGNPGGYVNSTRALAGWFFKKDMKICEFRERKETRELWLDGHGNDAFDGRVVVLIDSDSASGSEMLSGFFQLEKRATIVGDTSAGMLMASRYFQHDLGLDAKVPFGLSITFADIVMKNGKRIEGVGVTPDEIVLPTGADLAAGRDPVLARALELLGQKVTSEDAGKIFDGK